MSSSACNADAASSRSKCRPRMYPVTIKREFPFRLINVPRYIEGEFIWSYLGRLGSANGIFNTEKFLNVLYMAFNETEWKAFQHWNYDADRPFVDSFMKIEGPEDWIMAATMYRYLLPFNSVGYQANKIRGYAAEFSRDVSKVFPRIDSFVTELKMCPQCASEDRRDGMFHYHTVHQFPGMSVCPYHGCPLESYAGTKGDELFSPTFEATSVREDDAAYAAFCLKLYELHPSCSLQDTYDAILLKLRENYGLFEIGAVVSAVQEDPRFKTVPELSSNLCRLLQNRYLDAISPENGIHILMRIFTDAEQFCVYIDRGKREITTQEISSDLSPVGEYGPEFLRVRCSRCGRVFPTTYSSLIAGCGCPDCNEVLSETEIFNKMFSTVSHGRWMLGSAFRNMGSHRIIIVDTETEERRSVLPREFIYLGHVGVPVLRMNFDDYAKEVGAIGGYELLKVSGNGHNVRFHLRRTECGHEFSVLRSKFLENPFCRGCSARKGRYRDCSGLIEEISDGRFKWTGDTSQKRYSASCGDKTISAKNMAELVPRIRKWMEFGDERRDLSSVHERMDSWLEERRGQLIFSDSIDIGEPRRIISNRIASLVRKDILVCMAKGVFYFEGEIHSASELLLAKYFDRYGNIQGCPVGRTLLNVIKGKGVCSGRPEFCISDDGRHTVRTSVHKVGAISVNIRFIIPQITEESWRIISVMESFSDESFTDAIGSDDMRLLHEWCLSEGLTVDACAAYGKYYSDLVVGKVTELLEEI